MPTLRQLAEDLLEDLAKEGRRSDPPPNRIGIIVEAFEAVRESALHEFEEKVRASKPLG